MLDHDLEKQLKVESSASLTGSELINVIIHNIDKDVPVLVHSMNPGMAPVMVRRLESAKFDVTRIPMTKLTEEKLTEWVECAGRIAWIGNHSMLSARREHRRCRPACLPY